MVRGDALRDALVPVLKSVPDGLRELSHGLFVWAMDKQSFVDGSNYFFVLTESNCIYLGNVHVNFYLVY